MHQPNPGAAQAISIIERRILALNLRKQGHNYRQIAADLKQRDDVSDNYNEAQAYKDVMAALKQLNEKLNEETAELRRLELERLDELFVIYYPQALEGALIGNHPAIDKVLDIMDRRAKYTGTYVPVKVAPTDPTGEKEHVSIDDGAARKLAELIARGLASTS